VIIGADIDHAVSHRWRGADHAASSSGPQGRACWLAAPIRFEGIQLVIIGADIDHVVSHRWRGGVDPIPGSGGPQGRAHRLTTPICLEGIQLVIEGADIDHAVGYRWRGADRAAGSGGPRLYQCRNRRRRKLRLVGVEATMLGIEAKLYAVLHDELVIG